jgi:FKBP-type peptidyl-prolyl cis-trans isomerase
MIKGWDEGMKVINKNARVQLIMSSDFGYGSSGAGVIPPYQTLVFVIIMKDIKPSN